jgi:hypothetical protein
MRRHSTELSSGCTSAIEEMKAMWHHSVSNRHHYEETPEPMSMAEHNSRPEPLPMEEHDSRDDKVYRDDDDDDDDKEHHGYHAHHHRGHHHHGKFLQTLKKWWHCPKKRAALGLGLASFALLCLAAFLCRRRARRANYVVQVDVPLPEYNADADLEKAIAASLAEAPPAYEESPPPYGSLPPGIVQGQMVEKIHAV